MSREYVRAIAQDKKKALWFTLRDKLKESIRNCEPSAEGLEAQAADIDTAFDIWANTFSRIDDLVAEFEAGQQTGPQALETVEWILEL